MTRDRPPDGFFSRPRWESWTVAPGQRFGEELNLESGGVQLKKEKLAVIRKTRGSPSLCQPHQVVDEQALAQVQFLVGQTCPIHEKTYSSSNRFSSRR